MKEDLEVELKYRQSHAEGGGSARAGVYAVSGIEAGSGGSSRDGVYTGTEI